RQRQDEFDGQDAAAGSFAPGCLLRSRFHTIPLCKSHANTIQVDKATGTAKGRTRTGASLRPSLSANWRDFAEPSRINVITTTIIARIAAAPMLKVNAISSHFVPSQEPNAASNFTSPAPPPPSKKGN